MFFAFDNGSQTCNRFLSLVPVLERCIKNNEKAYIFCHDKEIDNFPNLRKNKYIKFPLYSKFIHQFIGINSYTKFISRIYYNRFWDLGSILEKLNSKLFMSSWKHHKKELTPEILSQIKEIFKPSDQIIKDIDNQFKQSKINEMVLIGLHIRRGDYKTWRNGEYYYSDEEYLNICQSLTNYFKKLGQENLIFFISTNEKIDLNKFREFNVFQLENGSSMKDLYALSKCDYIVGPPSTFSTWAALMGGVPYDHIYKTKDYSPSFNSF